MVIGMWLFGIRSRAYSPRSISYSFWQIQMGATIPFGLCVASEIFQKRLHQALDGLEGIFSIADDIIVYGAGDTAEEANADHDQKFEELLQRCRTKGIKLNKKKLKFKQKKIPYLSHLVTSEGLKPDPDKVEAVICRNQIMWKPCDVFVGLSHTPVPCQVSAKIVIRSHGATPETDT